MRIFLLLILLTLSVSTVGTIRKFPPRTFVSAGTSPELRKLIRSANKLFAARDFIQAAAIYREGLTLSIGRHELRAKARFLHGLGNCHLLTTEYRWAVAEYLEARKLAAASADWATVALVSTSLYTTYSRMGDLTSASQSMQEALAFMPWTELKDNLPHVLINLANAKMKLGVAVEAEHYFAAAVTAADDLGDSRSSVEAWSGLGYHHLIRKEFAEADRAYTRAFYLRKIAKVGDPANSYMDLGMLRLAQGDWQSAIRFLEEGVAVARRQPISFPVLIFYKYLGRARAAGGDLRAALTTFETAIVLANEWRLDVVSTDTSQTGAEVTLQDLYADYIETGMKLYAQNKSPALAYKMFLAAEENRAVSFRQRLKARKKLSPEYWQTLEELRRAEIVLFRKNSPQEHAVVESLRIQLAQIETQLDVPAAISSSTYSHRINENSGSVKSLSPIQGLISRDEALISFHLGETTSYAWAFTREGFEVYTLPRRSWIARSVRGFQEAVRTGASSAKTQGQELYNALFGSVNLNVINKKHWLLILDDTLYEMPAPALVISSRLAPTTYLIERNSLRLIPSAEMLRLPPRSSPAGPFLGVGDPIYNVADSRWHSASVKSLSWRSLFHFAQINPTTTGPQFTRLVGSGREVRISAATWRPQPPAVTHTPASSQTRLRQQAETQPSPILLQGKLCQRTQIEQNLKTGPAVVHFATHIVQLPDQPEEALIAIGLDAAGEPDFLTISEISHWRHPLGLVVLSGCSSGTGKALPGAGLFGLTRAWLLAGARTAIASQWPTPDDTGPLFQTFYQSLRPTTLGLSSASAADALQTAQVGMLRSDGWRADPKFWAAFFVVGKD